MQLFIDTANLKEIEQMKDFIDGVTTNPSLVSKEKISFKESLKLISQIIDGPISAEVISTELMSMLKEAFELAKISENIVIKLPMTQDGLKASKALYKEGIKTNVTLCFSANQALLAAKAFATYVSPFIGRLEDIGENGIKLIEDIVKIYEHYEFKTKIISASIRKPKHVSEVAKAKSHVATIPYNILKQLIKHPLTDKGIEIFIKDWQESGLNI